MMKNIMVFCIPAHGHHNPTLPVVQELVKRGNTVRYYSFSEFQEKIEDTGAEFINCDSFLPELSKEQEEAMKNVSTTEMTIVDLQITGRMDSFLKEQVEEFKPDVIYTDSVCFWGKLTARKYKIPMVVSTTTFAFNKYSSQYMKNSFSEIMDLVKGSKRVKAELKKLEEYGYHEKSIMPLVNNDNYTDTVVYATKQYQPCSNTFSNHYAFVGPSLLTDIQPQKEHGRPLVFISLGTVINDRPAFYHSCIQALSSENVDVIISCGKAVDTASFGKLPENVQVFPYVNQLEVLSRANVFLTHCGMNSVSESLYMATPMVLFPQTNEQMAVARRAEEMGAGIMLKKDCVEDIRTAIRTVLENHKIADSARACSENFRSASGPAGAAKFIENAPHIMPEEDRASIRREVISGVLQLLFWCIAVACIILVPKQVEAVKWWMLVIAANVIFGFYRKWVDKMQLSTPKSEM